MLWQMLTAFCILCGASGALADSTFVAGGNVNGSWSVAGSPYVVQGNLTVTTPDSLTIGPGVRVYFAGPYSLLVTGYLAVAGTEADSVVFTTDTLLNPSKWRGINLPNANDSSYLRYAAVEFSYAPGPLSADSSGGALYISAGTTVRVEHCSFRFCRAELVGGGVYSTGSTLWMDSCSVEGNVSRAEGGGLYLHNSVNSFVRHTMFYKNHSNGSGGGAYVRGSTPVFAHCLLDSNSARVNGGGIMFKNSSARLDSSTLSGNNGKSHGGGIACEGSSPPIYDCTIAGNYTTDFDGGGVYLWESSPHMVRCRVLNNHSADDGGGIHSYRATSNGVFDSCEVRGNSCAGEGGGIWVTLDGAPTFNNCLVKGNTAGLYGGALFLRNEAKPVFNSCDFDSNTSLGNGGGLSLRQSQPKFTNCRVRWNDAAADGGGAHLWESANAVFTACEFSHNTADSTGGGVSTSQSDLFATNCLLVQNNATFGGSGLAAATSSSVTMVHCTIAANLNGGVRIDSSIADIENSILALTFGDAAYFASSEASRIAYSVVDGAISFQGSNPAEGPALIGVPVTVNGNGDACDTYFNLLADPQFVDAINGNWTPGAGSQALGSGNWNRITSDILGNSRPQPAGSLPDMGAVESADGPLPAFAFGPLSGTLGPDTVKVIADVYVDTTQTLTLLPGTVMLFCGPSSMDIRGTLLAQGASTDSIQLITNVSQNPGRWRGILMSVNAGLSQLAHVRIAESRALTTDRTQGGALRLEGVSPTLSRCTIENAAAALGGAVYSRGGAAAFSQCRFRNCTADSGGFVHANNGATLSFNKCKFEYGTAIAGGAILGFGASGTVENCVFTGNSASSVGGALHLDTAPFVLRNNLIHANSAGTSGGGVWMGGITTTVEFNTIADNTAVDGAGLYMRFGSSQIKNNIIAENHGDGMFFFVANTSVVRYNCVAANDSGNFVFFANSPAQAPVGIGALDSLNLNGDPCDRYRNIQLDPQFVSGNGHAYYLNQLAAGGTDDSPCIGAADTTAVAPAGSTRVDFVSDLGVADQGYHGPQVGAPPIAVDDLTIRGTADSLKLTWSYDGNGLFFVQADTSTTGNFATTVAVTTDTTVTLPLTPPLSTTKGFFVVRVENLP